MAIQKKLILPEIKKLHDLSVKQAVEEYKMKYLALEQNKEFDVNVKKIPFKFSSDTRWSKPWGWNAKYGTAFAEIMDPFNRFTLDRRCIGAVTAHRPLPGKKINIEWDPAVFSPEEIIAKAFQKSAGGIDPYGIGQFTTKMMHYDLDPTHLLHDADAKGYKAACDAKARFLLNKISPEHRGKFTDCIQDLYCNRHTSKAAAKAFVNRNIVTQLNVLPEQKSKDLHDFARFNLTGQCHNGNDFCKRRKCWELNEINSSKTPLNRKHFPIPKKLGREEFDQEKKFYPDIENPFIILPSKFWFRYTIGSRDTTI